MWEACYIKIRLKSLARWILNTLVRDKAIEFNKQRDKGGESLEEDKSEYLCL